MNTQVALKNFNLSKKWDQCDLAYEYSKLAIESLYLNNLKGENLQEIIQNYFLNNMKNPNLKIIDKILNYDTKNYLILSRNIDKLKKLNETTDYKKRIPLYFEIITNALLEARKKDDYILEIQFEHIEWFLYATWFLNKPKESIKIFSKLLSESYRYPNASFDEQCKVFIKSAKKTKVKNKEFEHLKSTLINVFTHFITNLKIINFWESKKDKELSSYEKALKNKIYEWILIHYIFPLYNCIENDKKNDKEYEKLYKQVYEYTNIDNIFLCKILNWMLDTIKLVKKLNDPELNEKYNAVKEECKKLLTTNALFEKTNWYKHFS